MTLNGLLDVPPTNSNVTSTNPASSEPVYCVWVNRTLMAIIRMILLCIHKKFLPVESNIIPIALVIEPATIPGPSDDGTFKLIPNISSPSTILSFITDTLTVVVVAPAGIVALRGVELKSFPFREMFNLNYHA